MKMSTEAEADKELGFELAVCQRVAQETWMDENGWKVWTPPKQHSRVWKFFAKGEMKSAVDYAGRAFEIQLK